MIDQDFDGPGDLSVDTEQGDDGITSVVIKACTDDGDELLINVDPDTAREIAADLIECAHEAEELNQ